MVKKCYAGVFFFWAFQGKHMFPEWVECRDQLRSKTPFEDFETQNTKVEGVWTTSQNTVRFVFSEQWCQIFKKQQFGTKTTLHHPKFNRVSKHYSLENVHASPDSNIGDFGYLSSQTKIFHQPGFPFLHLSHRKKPGWILSINYCLETETEFWKGIGRWSTVIHNRNKGSQSKKWFEPPFEKYESNSASPRNMEKIT